MSLKVFIKEFGKEVGTDIMDVAVNGWTDQSTCPRCGGDLFESWNGYLECEDCHDQFAIDENGVLFTEVYDD